MAKGYGRIGFVNVPFGKEQGRSMLARTFSIAFLVTLTFLAAHPAAAQVTIISNLPGNDLTQSAGLSDLRNKGMGFTMPAGDDYILDHVTLRLETYTVATPAVVQVWTNVGGLPGAPVETLTNPTFAASGIAD